MKAVVVGGGPAGLYTALLLKQADPAHEVWPSPGVTRMRKNLDQFMALPLSDSLKRSALETNPERLLP